MTKEELAEKKRLQVQRWRENNRERHREYQRNYRITHKEECEERNKKWNEENPELVTGYKRKYTENNPGVNNESSARWRKKNKEHKRVLTRQRRARIRKAEGTISIEDWKAILKLYGTSCLACGEIKPLTMDHIIPIVYGGTHTTDNVQPLCLSCNSSKGTQTIDYRPLLGL